MTPSLRKAVLIVLVLAGLASAGAIAYATAAAFTGDGRPIEACANAQNGGLRVLSTDLPTPLQECKDNETAISWNREGLAGQPGPAGVQGQAGVNGVSEYEVVTAAASPSTYTQTTLSATCPTGKKPAGGGVANNPVDQFATMQSYPSGSSWVASVAGPSTGTGTFTVYAVCVIA
jgi:hypothetical protein